MIVLTTVSSKKEAVFIAKKLLNKKAAACVNFYKIKSLYTWKDEVCKDKEFQLFIKTNNYKKVKKIILKHHSYELPEIIAFKFDKVYKKYDKWIKNTIKIKNKQGKK